MRIPDESLEDFNTANRKPAEPPALKIVRLTGEIEVLKPLVRGEYSAKSAPVPGGMPVRPAPRRLSPLHRSLAVGAAFAVIAVVVAIGIQLAVFGPPMQQDAPGDAAMVSQPDSTVAPAEEPFPFGHVTDENTPAASVNGLNTRRLTARRRLVRPRVRRAAHRPKRSLPPPQFLVSEFIPTTRIIYVENGEIKTRIEPWLTAAHKKQQTLSN